MPEVRLLAHTPEAERLVAVSARVCTSPVDFDRLEEQLTPGKIRKLVRHLVEVGHHSTLEHVNFTWLVSGISRVASHQLVRHRIASYSQASQRYISLEEDCPFETPPSLEGRDDWRERYDRHFRESHELYRSMVDDGIPCEDARFVLPQAVTTRVLFTMNARTLLHFFALRSCERAQHEIRAVARKMLALARDVCPTIFEKAGPPCVTEGRCRETQGDCPRRPEQS